MFQLNEKVKNLTPYEPISGTYEIRLDANESFLKFPQEIEEKMVEALKNTAFNRYPDPNATKLVEGFSKYFNIDSNCVTAGNGSDELISVIMNAFLQKGDKILTLEPDFSMYRFYAEIAECESVKYQKNENLDVDIDDVISELNITKDENCDAVGAGDSFTAAFVAGIIKGLDIKEAHYKASRLAAYVCTKQGAMPDIPKELLF